MEPFESGEALVDFAEADFDGAEPVIHAADVRAHVAHQADDDCRPYGPRRLFSMHGRQRVVSPTRPEWTDDGAAHGQTVPNRKPRARSAGTSSAAASTA